MKIFTLILPFLAIQSFAGECLVDSAPQNSLRCSGQFKARSLKDLDKYQKELDKLSKKNRAKSLIIDFDLLSDDDIKIESPCSIRIQNKQRIETPKNVCLRARDNIIIDHSSSLKAFDFNMIAGKRLAIRKGAKIDVDTLVLNSLGENEFSRAHIRHSSTVRARSLLLNAYSLSTLGHTSSYIVNQDITLISRNKEARIYHKSLVQSPKLTMNAKEAIRISSRVSFLGDVLSASAEQCLISPHAVMENQSYIGSCYPVDSSAPNVIVTADRTEGKAPLTVRFDLSQSFDEDQDIAYFEWDFGNGSTLVSEDYYASYTYTEEGEYTVVVRAYDSLGNVGSDDILITVFVEKAPVIQYEVRTVADNPYDRIIDMRSSYDLDGSIVRYTFDFGDGQSYSSPFIGSVRHKFPGHGTYTITLKLEDNDGNISTEVFDIEI